MKKSTLSKINFALILSSIVVLLYCFYNYQKVSGYKLEAKDKINYLNKAAGYFSISSLIICFIIWIWINVLIIKTKQLKWIWLPFTFVTVTTIINCYFTEAIFAFKQDNGMWNGSFLVSYFAGIVIIFLFAIVLLVNYFVIKYLIKQKNSNRI